ncbi:unnamed protein product [Schistosoma rodhaini]|uniref:Uncharacterized protein n=1 Tax=Schistosoma rodhaini TaxID=6188 RepID=A0AA85FB25_9TREM|nr:unnamed protein product [Schistosoma rodhaini]CAH8493028.1 unnamed protein product [Schistosoma rodhaini]
MRLLLILYLSLIISLINCDNEEDDSDLSTITEELINSGLDYANLLHGWIEKNVGKNEIKIIKKNLMKFGQLALNFIDSTIQNLIKDDNDDDGEDINNNNEHNNLQRKHSEL